MIKWTLFPILALIALTSAHTFKEEGAISIDSNIKQLLTGSTPNEGKCYSPFALRDYGGKGMPTWLKEICPGLLLQELTGVCDTEHRIRIRSVSTAFGVERKRKSNKRRKRNSAGEEDHGEVGSGGGEGEGEEHHDESRQFFTAQWDTWLIALGAVVSISIIGFLTVMVLPTCCTVCYNHLQQFLIAMGVGTLTGDAILHLIPHSLFAHEEHSHEEEGNDTLSVEEEEGHEEGIDETDIINKGTLILCGIFALYVMEQLIAILVRKSDERRAKKEHAHAHGHGHGHEHSHTPGHGHGNGREKINSHHSNLDSEDADESVFDGKDQTNGKRCSIRSNSSMRARRQGAALYGTADEPSGCHGGIPMASYIPSCEDVVLQLHTAKFLRSSTTDCMTECASSDCGGGANMLSGPVRARGRLVSTPDESTEMLLPERDASARKYKHGQLLHRCTPLEQDCANAPLGALSQSSICSIPPRKTTKDQGCGTADFSDEPKIVVDEEHLPAIAAPAATHTHGHSHGGGDVNTQALMVIVADAFHNFIDGITIGAAYTQSLPGGLSTTIAVTLHEIPHELGDFAVLMQQGLSIKKGLMYNAISGVICLAGTVIGVGFGSDPAFTQIIFAVAAGMFLYVALVDMLPQISNIETSHGESPFCHLIYQSLGLLSGMGIMFLIAHYEGDLSIWIQGAAKSVS